MEMADTERSVSPVASTSRQEQGQAEQGVVVCRITAGLPEYDPKESKEIFKRMEEQIANLSEEEFVDAVRQDDYQLVLASMRSGSIPRADTMTNLFLHAVRSGMTDMALLLARQVPDLTAQNIWGENALTMAAMMGDIRLAYGLLTMCFPLNARNSEKQTAYELSNLYMHRSFQRFCETFSVAHNIPLE